MDMQLLTQLTRVALVFTSVFCIGNILCTEIRGEGYTLSKIIGDAISRRKHAYRLAKIMATNKTREMKKRNKQDPSTHQIVHVYVTAKPIEGKRCFRYFDATEHGFEEHNVSMTTACFKESDGACKKS